MVFDPDIHRRRSIRLKDYNYGDAGGYFVTLCTFERESLFGDVENEAMRLNGAGAALVELWQTMPRKFPQVQLDEYVIMPNHFHAILHLVDCVGEKQGSSASPAVDVQDLVIKAKAGEAGEALASPLQKNLHKPQGTVAGSLGAIMQNFKSISTRRINKLIANPGGSIWQRNYYEHVIRNEVDLDKIREYIVNNPLNWMLDENHPTNRSV